VSNHQLTLTYFTYGQRIFTVYWQFQYLPYKALKFSWLQCKGMMLARTRNKSETINYSTCLFTY